MVSTGFLNVRYLTRMLVVSLKMTIGTRFSRCERIRFKTFFLQSELIRRLNESIRRRGIARSKFQRLFGGVRVVFDARQWTMTISHYAAISFQLLITTVVVRIAPYIIVIFFYYLLCRSRQLNYLHVYPFLPRVIGKTAFSLPYSLLCETFAQQAPRVYVLLKIDSKKPIIRGWGEYYRIVYVFSSGRPRARCGVRWSRNIYYLRRGFRWSAHKKAVADDSMFTSVNVFGRSKERARFFIIIIIFKNNTLLLLLAYYDAIQRKIYFFSRHRRAIGSETNYTVKTRFDLFMCVFDVLRPRTYVEVNNAPPDKRIPAIE